MATICTWDTMFSLCRGRETNAISISRIGVGAEYIPNFHWTAEIQEWGQASRLVKL